MDPVIRNLFSRLKKLADVDVDIRQDLSPDGIYSQMLTRLFQLQGHVQEELSRLKEVKKSTREELYRRLYIARDFTDANYNKKLELEDIARVACMSVHHFKREFKILFRSSPHRYLFVKRMENAKQFLRNSSDAVNEISVQCGFENSSSFIRQFKNYTGKTPGAFREISLIH